MTTAQRAREIMGPNFFGVEDAIRHFGLTPSEQEIAALTEIPFSEATLIACEESHILVAVLPMSILEIRSKARPPARSFVEWLSASSRVELFEGEIWYKEQAFAKDKGTPE